MTNNEMRNHMKCCGLEQTTAFCAHCGQEMIPLPPAVGDGALVPIYGYARASRSAQVLSPEVQEEMIRKKGATIPHGEFIRCRRDKGVSAKVTRWNDPIRRPEFGKLMREMQPGSHLIVWRLNRLERSMFGALDCLRWLVERGINLHVLEYGGGQLDLDTPTGRVMLGVLAGFLDIDAAERSTNVKLAKQYRREHGLSADGHPPLGKTRYKQQRGKTAVTVEPWCPKQCALIREIKHRFDAGETMTEIIVDFDQRDERMWNQKRWAKRNRKQYRKLPNGKPMPATRKGEWYSRRFFNAYWYYTKLLASGKDLEDREASPEMQELAVQQIENRVRGRQNFQRIARLNLHGGIPERPRRSGNNSGLLTPAQRAKKKAEPPSWKKGGWHVVNGKWKRTWKRPL